MAAPADDFQPPPVHHDIMCVRFHGNTNHRRPWADGLRATYTPRPHPHPPGWFSSAGQAARLHGARMQSGKSPWIGSISPSSWDVGEDTWWSAGHCAVTWSGQRRRKGPLGTHGPADRAIDLKAKAPRLSPPWMEQFGRTMRTCPHWQLTETDRPLLRPRPARRAEHLVRTWSTRRTYCCCPFPPSFFP